MRVGRAWGHVIGAVLRNPSCWQPPCKQSATMLARSGVASEGDALRELRNPCRHTEWWGINDGIKALAVKLHADTGLRCLIPDLYKVMLHACQPAAAHWMLDGICASSLPRTCHHCDAAACCLPSCACIQMCACGMQESRVRW